MPKIFGTLTDKQGRCLHYYSDSDVIANKCYSCKKYYACFKCHNQFEEHPFTPWPQPSKEKIVCCGNCTYEMPGDEYMDSKSCPNCKHPFNEKCSMHKDYYFKF